LARYLPKETSGTGEKDKGPASDLGKQGSDYPKNALAFLGCFMPADTRAWRRHGGNLTSSQSGGLSWCGQSLHSKHVELLGWKIEN
jgi:hypothetical protein